VRFNGQICFTLIMLSIFVAMVAIALGYPPASRFLPLVIGIPGIVLTIGQLVVDVGELRRSAPVRDPEKRSDDRGARVLEDQLARDEGRAGSVPKREIVLFAYFFGLVAGVILFGFWLAIPAFLIAFLRLRERESWRLALLLTTAGTAVLYFVFDRMLSIRLHEGFITDAVREWFAG